MCGVISDKCSWLSASWGTRQSPGCRWVMTLTMTHMTFFHTAFSKQCCRSVRCSQVSGSSTAEADEDEAVVGKLLRELWEHSSVSMLRGVRTVSGGLWLDSPPEDTRTGGLQYRSVVLCHVFIPAWSEAVIMMSPLSKLTDPRNLLL